MEREVHAVRKRVLGDGHPDTLSQRVGMQCRLRSRAIWLDPSRAKDCSLRQRRSSARCLQWRSGCWETRTRHATYRGHLAASLARHASVDDNQGGSISYALEKPDISIASTSAAEPASKRAK